MMPSFLIPLVGVLAVVFIAYYGFTTHGYMVHLLLLGAPVAIAMINNPAGLLILVYGLYSSQLILPGLPQGLQVVHMLMFMFVAITIARNIIEKPNRKTLGTMHLWVYALLVLLLIIIYHRGLGLYSGGGDLVGGSSYVKLFIGAGFLFCARYYALTPSQLRKTIIFTLIGCFIPAIAQVVFLASGGRIYQQFTFVQPYVYGLLESLAGMQAGQGEFRLHAFSTISTNLLSLILVFIPFQGVHRLKVLAWTALCLLMATLSGFRTNVLEIMIVTVMFIIFSAPRGLKATYSFGAAALFIGGLLLAIPLMPHLPFSVQRALSWLPFADVSFYAKHDADASALWRLEVWEYCLSQWKEFAWIGRGFTVSMSDLMILSPRRDLILEAYYGHNYHSGPISLLLDLGVPGVIICTGFLLSSTLYAFKPLEHTSHPFIARAHDLIRVKLIYSVFSFYVIHGDARSTLITIFLNLALLETIRASSMKYAAVNPTPAAATPVSPVRRPFIKARAENI